MLCGCGFKGSVTFDEGKENAWVQVTDMRDGEVFYYNNNTINNPVRGVGVPSSVDIVTSDGRKMTINSDMMAYLKFREVDGPSDAGASKHIRFEL